LHEKCYCFRKPTEENRMKKTSVPILKSYGFRVMKGSLVAAGLIWMLGIVIGNAYPPFAKNHTPVPMASASINPIEPGILLCALGTATPIPYPTPNYSLPVLSFLSPKAATAGGPEFTLTAFGSNYRTNSTVLWNGSSRKTNYVNSRVLQALIPAADIAAAGTANVSTFTPDAGASSSLPFTIMDSPPAFAPLILGKISPNCAAPGGSAFVLTAYGTNFVNQSVVQWNGTHRKTTFVNTRQITAAIPSGDIATEGTAMITVETLGVGSSNPLPFTVGICK
jgi:hypothetical protein